MNKRVLWGALVSTAVLLTSGAAFSGGTTTSDVQLMDFVESTQRLWAYPRSGALTEFQHTRATIHLPGVFRGAHPPDPCDGITRAWNNIVRIDERRHIETTRVFLVLLDQMARFQCNATVTSTDGASPAPIVSIAPVP